MRIGCLLLIFLLNTISFVNVSAQEAFSFKQYNQRSLAINKNGMVALGSWASANIIVSSGLWIADNGSQEDIHFYQMNIAWNAVNLGIAIFSYLDSQKKLKEKYGLAETVDIQKKHEKAFLFNTGLDVAYILAGVLMLESGANNEKNRDILRGFGRSFILQGSFLFLFDATLYAIHKKHGKELNRYLQGLQVGVGRVGYVYRF